MKPVHIFKLTALASLIGALSAPALAQDAGYFYGGASLGESRSDIDQNRIAAGQLGAGPAVTTLTEDKRGISWKAFGGYQLTKNFGVELGYFKLGQFGFSSTTTPAGGFSGKERLTGINLDLVGTLPVTDSFSLLGRVGAQHAKTSDLFSGSGAVVVTNPNPTRKETNYKYGVGLQYEFNPNVLVRAEAERYRVNDAVGNRDNNVNVYSLGLVIPFGRVAKTEPAAYVPPPPPPPQAAEPPPPPPPPAPPPPPPPPKRVKFSADSMFNFNKATIGTQGKASLDSFLRELQGTQFDTITVEGYADRLGSDSYNMKLSQERADAVKSYLVSTGGLDGSKITTIAKGESSPVTKPEDCKGLSRAKLIVCLQPDRRVEVEVVGQQPADRMTGMH